MLKLVYMYIGNIFEDNRDWDIERDIFKMFLETYLDLRRILIGNKHCFKETEIALLKVYSPRENLELYIVRHFHII